MVIQQVVLFIDHHNIYKGARETFFDKKSSHFSCGQFDPVSMGELICDRAPAGFSRQLKQARIYTGQPNSTKDPKSYGASRRQYEFWCRRGAKVISRPLKYPYDFPARRPQEKGIDVALAIDFIRLAIEGDYEVGIIASTDTDLVPAVDFVIERHWGNCRVEVAAWTGPQRSPRLSSAIRPIWCHWLNRSNYDAVEDRTDYTV